MLCVRAENGAGSHPSMKVPPKRKGNIVSGTGTGNDLTALNESPSEKEGKFSSSEPPGTFTLYPQ